MTAQTQNLPSPVIPTATENSLGTCRCCHQYIWKRLHRHFPPRQMSVDLLTSQSFQKEIKSQYCSLPVLSKIVPEFLLKINGQVDGPWMKNSRVDPQFESIERSMSDTSDYFSSSPATSKEILDSDYDSGQEWTYMSLSELFSPEDSLSTAKTNDTSTVLTKSCPTPSDGNQHLQQVPIGGSGSCSESSGSSVSSTHSPSGRKTSQKVKSSEETRTRVLDNEGFIRRAACVCLNEDDSKVILITSKTDPEGWLIPGGGLEADELEETAAQREVWEEAGIRGRILRCLGTFQSDDELTHKKKRTTVFALQVTELCQDFPEAVTYGRQRAWFTIEDAIEKLKRCKKNQILYLKAL